MESVTQINWFPGHMKKAVDELKTALAKVDFIIEVMDARAIKVSSNHEIKTLIKDKPLIQVALKKDLCDLQACDNKEIIFANTKQAKYKEIIINQLNKLFEQKIQKLKNKGLIKPEFIGIVIGLPNVGKSSLINFLSAKNTLKVENRSGVTKNQTLKKINDQFYLIDTPGIFFKKINSLIEGYQLSILNCINQNVVPLYDVLKYGYTYFQTNYHQALNTYFQLSENLDFDSFINHLCEQYKFKLNNHEYDFERCYQFLFNLFSNSLICKFHFN